MSEDFAAEERSPADFADILSSAEPPLIVGGQAVNVWAELYAAKIPELNAFAPFTSRDADIYGSRALAETLAHRTGWTFTPIDERDSDLVAILTKATSGGPSLTIEVLQEVNGLTAADLRLDTTIELAPGERYRAPSPLVLLKAKLYNLASLANLDRPQDLRHVRMLWHIVPQYFNELCAGQSTTQNAVGAIHYLRTVVHAGFAGNVSRQHALDFRQLIPPSFGFAPIEIQQAVREFMAEENVRGSSTSSS